MTDAELFSDFPGRQEIARAEEAARDKARMVLRALSDAGLTPPFGFNPEDAVDLWGAQLDRYTGRILGAAVTEWVTAGGRDWPTLGEFNRLARGVEMEEERQQSDLLDDDPCPECNDDHWVRVDEFGKDVVDARVRHDHVRPCGTCPEMRDRYELYVAGHFNIDHRTCEKCLKYNEPARWRARMRAAERARR